MSLPLSIPLRVKVFGLLLLALGLISFLISLGVGSFSISWQTLGSLLIQQDPSIERSVVMELRLPRALSAMVVGGQLALAGCLMQALLRNPLADPYVLGVSGGASVAALLAIMFGLVGFCVS